MYLPPLFKEDRLEVLHGLISAHPFGLLISMGEDGLLANGLPFLLRPTPAPNGALLGHFSRGNPQWRNLDGQSVLAVFQGPQAYISPGLYETKRETGKVVPTWNYAMVQVRGVARVHEERDWLMQQVSALTARHEASRPKPWAASDAPEAYLESQLRGIVGVEIVIAEIAGKWKMSQNRPEADRRGVAEGLDNAEVAALVRQLGNV